MDDILRIGDKLLMFGDIVELIEIDRSDPRGASLQFVVVERDYRRGSMERQGA